MAGSDKGLAKDASAAQLEEKLLAQIEAAASTNMVTSKGLLAEIAETKVEIKRLCHAGNAEKAKRLTDLAVSRLRTGEASKE